MAELIQNQMIEDEICQMACLKTCMIKGHYDKRTNWSMAELIKIQRLENEMAKDKIGEDEGNMDIS